MFLFEIFIVFLLAIVVICAMQREFHTAIRMAIDGMLDVKNFSSQNYYQILHTNKKSRIVCGPIVELLFLFHSKWIVVDVNPFRMFFKYIVRNITQPNDSKRHSASFTLEQICRAVFVMM